MKKILLSIFVGLGLSTMAQQINTFPYTETFESGAGGWVSSGVNNSWAIGMPTSTSFITGTRQGCGGDSAFVTNPAGLYNNTEESQVESPMFDFTGLTVDPVLRFDHIFETESCCDEGFVEISLNGGNSWTKLGASGSGLNWYNDAANNWWNGSSGNAGEWRIASHILTGAAGSDSVQVRFRLSTDGSAVRDGFGFDNVTIGTSIIDAEPTALVAPIAPTGLYGSTETVTASIINSGVDTITNIQVCYSLDGGLSVCEMFTINLGFGETDSVTFSTTADLSGVGVHTLIITTNLTNDLVVCNDTAEFQLTTLPIISSFPYSEDFEADNGFWISGGTNNSWEYGQPDAANDFINASAGCGANAWVTNLDGNYNNNESSYIESPVFDFSSFMNDPVLKFDLIFETEGCCDEGFVEISLDGGATFSRLGIAGSGVNWYNDVINNWWNGNSGNTGEWVSRLQTLTGAAGNANVVLRLVISTDGSVSRDGFGIDNIIINTDVTNNSVVELISPVSACTLTSTETVTATIFNNGLDTVFSLPVCYSLDSATSVCETFTVTIAPGDSASVSFMATADLSAVGAHELVLYTNEVSACIDSISFNVDNNELAGSTITQTIASGDSIVVNGTTYNTTVTGAIEVFTNVGPNGCDSTVTINLTVIDNSTSISVNVITAGASGSGVAYQWIDCNNGNTAIAGETNQDFTVSVTGDYAVVITQNGVMDTSECVNVMITGIDENSFGANINMYPNPTNNNVTIDLGDVTQAAIIITDLAGKAVSVVENNNANLIKLTTENLTKGIYFVTIKSNNNQKVMKLVKE